MDVIGRYLKELGLTQYEADAYIAILEKGLLTATECSAASGVPRPRCYDVLRSLMEKGLVRMEPGRPVRYSAIPPNIGLLNLYKTYQQNVKRDLESKERTLKFLLDNLSQVYTKGNYGNIEEYVWVSKEDLNPLSHLEILRDVKTMFYLITPYSESIDSESEFYNALLDALSRGVKIKLIQPISGTVNFQAYDYLIAHGMEIKHMLNPRGFFSISDEEVFIRLIKDKKYVGSVRIRDEFTRETLLDYFNRVWEHGKDYKEMKELYRRVRPEDFEFTMNLPSKARIHYVEIDEKEGYVEFYIPLINAKGYISVFWFEENAGTVEELINKTSEKIRAASVQLGEIKSTGTMKIVEGRWKNLVLGSGPIKYRIMGRGNKIYLIVEGINAGERRDVEREAMIALDLIADTFTV
ncbi:MAG: TrmB family transcriptional regulator [Euryarchaeota archaeon]|nr:TrmB family transcriptional regulator [Euryarchaeota archaeon]